MLYIDVPQPLGVHGDPHERPHELHVHMHMHEGGN